MPKHAAPKAVLTALVVALCGAVPGPASADVQRISLGETLEVAVRESPTLAKATIDAAFADAQVATTLGGEDWLVAARLDFLVSRDEGDSGDFTGTDKVDTVGASTTVSKFLTTGGTVGITASGRYTSRVFEQVGAESITYDSSIEAFVSQPLLRSRGKGIARANYRRALTELSAAKLSEQAVARAVVRDIVDAYWQLAFAYRSLAIRKSSLELATERRRLTEASVGAGQVARTELDAVDQIIATRREEILAAELVVSERAIELRRIAGLEIGAQAIELEPTAQLAPPARKLDAEAVIEAALTASPELAILVSRGKGATIDVEVAENGLMPRLDVSLRAGPVGTAATIGKSLSNLAKANGYQVSGALDFSYELGTSGAKASARAARESMRGIKVSERDVKAQIAVAAVRSVKQAQNAAERIKISEQVIALSKKNVEAEKARFELGRSTNFDILERQEELKQANLRLAQATVDYLRALNIIDELTGTLLEKSGIKLP